jgi:hypothetical protein
MPIKTVRPGTSVRLVECNAGACKTCRGCWLKFGYSSILIPGRVSKCVKVYKNVQGELYYEVYYTNGEISTEDVSAEFDMVIVENDKFAEHKKRLKSA